MARSNPMSEPGVGASPVSWREFVELEDDDRRELIDGQLVEVEVPEYWLVDPEARTLERLVLDADGRHAIATSLVEDATFEPDTFPGLRIPLADLWLPEADAAR